MTRRLLFSYLSFALLILVGLEVPLGYVHHRTSSTKPSNSWSWPAKYLPSSSTRP